MDLIIKTTINKFTTAGLEVDLSKISALLELPVGTLLIKISKMISDGFLKGSIDKENSLFIPSGIPEVTLAMPQSDVESITPIQSSGKFVKQAEFVKSETKETSQEDFIKLIANISYVGSHVRVGIKAINNSDYPISEVTVKLIFSENLELFRLKPKYDFTPISSGISIKLPKLKEKGNTTVYIYYKPISLGDGEITGQFQYVNNKDFVRFIRIENLTYDLNPPKMIVKEIPTFEVEKFIQQENIKRDIRSYGLPDKLIPLGAFNHLIQIVKSFNFKLITKIELPDQNIAWFFGETEDKKTDVMIVAQIIANKIEFYASSFNEQVISALLTAFSIDLKKRIVNSRVVENEDEIYDLYCENCAGILPYFPKPGEKVICKWCNTENLVR
ncbi:MAG: hypothetical protein GY870_08070 [archaeon]|nr:hypothetical protein [archaeon]